MPKHIIAWLPGDGGGCSRNMTGACPHKMHKPPFQTAIDLLLHLRSCDLVAEAIEIYEQNLTMSSLTN
jgi:hypothetical protein